MILSKLIVDTCDEEIQRKDKKEKYMMQFKGNVCNYVFAKKTTGLTYQQQQISYIDLARLGKLHKKGHKIQEFQLQILPESHVKLPHEILQALELDVGDKLFAMISDDKTLILGVDRTKKGLFEEIDEIPYDDEELPKKEQKLINKAIKQCDKGRTVSWEELIKNKKIWK